MDELLKQRIGRIEPLVGQLQACTDPALKAGALELVQILMDFHGAGLDRMMEIVADSGDPGWDLIETFARDEVVANILLLHGLHPQDLETRVRRALDNVRPLLQSHGGNVDLVEVVGGQHGTSSEVAVSRTAPAS